MSAIARQVWALARSIPDFIAWRLSKAVVDWHRLVEETGLCWLDGKPWPCRDHIEAALRMEVSDLIIRLRLGDE